MTGHCMVLCIRLGVCFVYGNCFKGMDWLETMMELVHLRNFFLVRFCYTTPFSSPRGPYAVDCTLFLSVKITASHEYLAPAVVSIFFYPTCNIEVLSRCRFPLYFLTITACTTHDLRSSNNLVLCNREDNNSPVDTIFLVSPQNS